MGSTDAKTLNQALDAALTLNEVNVRDDEQISQLIHRDGVQEVIDLLAAIKRQAGFQRRANDLIGTGLLQNLLDIVADGHDAIPLGLKRLIGSSLCLGHLLKDNIVLHAGQLRDIAPDFLAGEAQDGCQQLGEVHQNAVQGTLGAAAGMVIGAVQAILDDVHIEVGHINDAEVVQCVVGAAEVIVVIGIAQVGGQLVAGLQCPAVNLKQLILCNHILGGVKIVDVAQHEAGGVAHLASDSWRKISLPARTSTV